MYTELWMQHASRFSICLREVQGLSDHQRLPPMHREVFVLRLWNSLQTHSWVGEIQHVRSGQIMYIRSPQELLVYLQNQMEPTHGSEREGEK
jgi:hypothetical protein